VNVLQFPQIDRSKRITAKIENLADKVVITAATDGFLEDDEAQTVTCRNGRLRHRRRAAWRAADAARVYWQARWRLENAIAVAQSSGIAEGSNHPIRHWTASDGGQEMLANYRDAIGKQLLTPAFDRCAVAWKEAALKAGDHEYTGVTTARAERAIADDLAFLAAHPVRRGRGKQSKQIREEQPCS